MAGAWSALLQRPTRQAIGGSAIVTLSDMLLPTYVQMLGALSTWLEKAEGQAAGELMSARI